MTKGSAALAAAGAVTLAAIVTGTWLVTTHRHSSGSSSAAAEREFQQLRTQFTNQLPLLDMDRRQARADMLASSNATELHSLHTVIFDTRGRQRLVRIDVPFWFARRVARPTDRDGFLQWLGQLTPLDDTEFDPEPIHLSWEQVARRGPGLIADYRHSSGGQFISWVD